MKKPPSRHIRMNRWWNKRRLEDKEFEGKSPEQIENEAAAHMSMINAPIIEAVRKGEITHAEATRQMYHNLIKSLQEMIKENEEDIDTQLHWGLTDTRKPELLEQQRIWMEKQRRENPAILGLQSQIDEWKQEITKAEQEIEKTYSLEAGGGEGEKE
jgi:hypothetical protein